jgi:hypothetical protein
MLGREPRLKHSTMRWLIITLMVINGVQLVILQATINAALTLQSDRTWLYVALSFGALCVSAALIGYAFYRSRGSRSGLPRR